jgi:hypothetical protein
MRSRFQLSVIAIFILALGLSSCDDKTTNPTPPKTYAIGDTGPSGVGIVFNITDGGLHGLESAPSDQTTTQPWSNITAGIGVTAQSTVIGAGLANSNVIIAQSGHTSSAALSCRNYTGGSLNDWFLPSRDELVLMYTNLAANGLGGFTGDLYWSSSENSGADAYTCFFNTANAGIPVSSSKTSLCNSRAIRAF